MLEHVLFATQGIVTEGVVERPNLQETLDFATGIFAAALMVISIVAYRRTNLRRLLFVSAAFGIYSFRAILPRMDVFLPSLETTTVEALLSSTGFIILALFFLAIVKKK